jgi:MFS family permease
MVGVLTVIYVFSFIDRQILALIVEPIKRDLHITDFQISLLMGFSFVFFYTLFGIPLGRLADVKSRRAIIAVGCALWSFMTALCGVAQNYLQMFLCRFGVGIGEAALSPSAFSMISDSFRKERLATAISVYSMGIYMGAGLAYLLGGIVVKVATSQEMYHFSIVGDIRPWQVIFFVVGLPGFLLGLLMYTIKEPVRRGITAAHAKGVPARQVLAYIKENRATFICHNVGFGLIALSTNAGGSWNPEYMKRTHGWTTAEFGIIFGAILVIAGTAGIVAAGRYSDYLAVHDYKDAPLRVGLYATFGLALFGAIFVLAPNGNVAAIIYVPLAFFAAAPFGVAPAAMQQMMPNAMRGQAGAIYIFTVNIIGLGLGPSAVAAMTDYVFHDPNKIRYSLLVVGAIAHLAAVLVLWRGMKPFAESVERLKAWKG